MVRWQGFAQGVPLTAVLLLGAPGPAFCAVPQAVVLSVERDEASQDCPDTAALVQAVNTRMQRRAVVEQDYRKAQDRLSVSILRDEKGYRAAIVGQGRLAGERAVDSSDPSCGALAEALSVTVSILVGIATSEPEPKPPEPPKAKVLPPIELAPKPQNELAVGGALTLGLPSDTGWALWLGGSHRVANWSLGAGLMLLPEQSVSFAPGKVSLEHAAVLLEGCRVFDPSRRLDLRLCAVPSAGGVHAKGEGYDPDRSVTRPWFSLGAAVESGGSLFGPIGWRAKALGLSPLNRERFTVDGGGVAYSPRRLVVALGLSLTVSI